MHVPIQEKERSCLCVLMLLLLPTMLILGFGIVPIGWHFFFFFFFYQTMYTKRFEIRDKLKNKITTLSDIIIKTEAQTIALTNTWRSLSSKSGMMLITYSCYIVGIKHKLRYNTMRNKYYHTVGEPDKGLQ